MRLSVCVLSIKAKMCDHFLLCVPEFPTNLRELTSKVSDLPSKLAAGVGEVTQKCVMQWSIKQDHFCHNVSGEKHLILWLPWAITLLSFALLLLLLEWI